MLGHAGLITLAVRTLAAGCGMVEEVAPPAPGNISEIRRPASPNTCLAGPPGFIPKPDLQTRPYNAAAEHLFEVMQNVVAAQPRVTRLGVDSDRLRADYVFRSRVFRFPDIVMIQVLPRDQGQSALVVYSYSLKGHYDFGVNRSRVSALLAALNVALTQHR